MSTSRVVALLSAGISLALAVLPIIAELDWTSTAGVIAGIVAVLGVTQKWLDGWQKHEARSDERALQAAMAAREMQLRREEWDRELQRRGHSLPRQSERPE